jgi:hypothetical protein
MPMNALTFTDADFSAALQYGGENCVLLIREPKMYKATFDLLKSVASRDPLGAATAVASAANTSGKSMLQSKTVRDGLTSGSFALSTFKASVGLVKVASMASPGAAYVVIGATLVQKTGIAVSLIGSDNEKAKCLGAITELAGSFAISAAAAPTGVLLVLTIASLTASAVNAYGSCQGVYGPGASAKPPHGVQVSSGMQDALSVALP